MLYLTLSSKIRTRIRGLLLGQSISNHPVVVMRYILKKIQITKHLTETLIIQFLLKLYLFPHCAFFFSKKTVHILYKSIEFLVIPYIFWSSLKIKNDITENFYFSPTLSQEEISQSQKIKLSLLVVFLSKKFQTTDSFSASSRYAQ